MPIRLKTDGVDNSPCGRTCAQTIRICSTKHIKSGPTDRPSWGATDHRDDVVSNGMADDSKAPTRGTICVLVVPPRLTVTVRGTLTEYNVSAAECELYRPKPPQYGNKRESD